MKRTLFTLSLFVALCSSSIGQAGNVHPVKYVSDLKIYAPTVVWKNGLVVYYDYDEALAASAKLKKPVMIDFTGIYCMNSRKMESQVWANPEVVKRLKNDFVIVSLYCDFDKVQLPNSEQYFSKKLNKKVTTPGDKNADFEMSKFNCNSLPSYFYVDEKGKKLVSTVYTYNPDIQKFIDHLDRVKANYKKTHP